MDCEPDRNGNATLNPRMFCTSGASDHPPLTFVQPAEHLADGRFTCLPFFGYRTFFCGGFMELNFPTDHEVIFGPRMLSLPSWLSTQPLCLVRRIGWGLPGWC